MQRILVLLSLIAMASAAIPNGYILDVTPTCTSGSDPAKVEVSSDLDVQVDLVCNSAHNISADDLKITKLKPKISFEVAYNGTKGCVFKSPTSTSNIYSITLELFWKEPGTSTEESAFLQTQKEVYTVVCSTGDNKQSESSPNSNNEYPFAPEQIGANKGSTLADEVTLSLMDVNGQKLSGNIALGKKVQLCAEANGTGYGIMAVDCTAKDNSDSYKILKGGCGDGVVLKSDEGFTSKDATSTSEFFRYFKFANASSMTFECTFVKCDGNCGSGDSCVHSRKRRDVSQEDGSGSLVIASDDEPSKRLRLVTASTSNGRSQSDEEYPSKTMIIYSSPKQIRSEPKQLNSDVKDQRIMFVMVSILSCFTAVALMMSLYVCTKQERLRVLDKLAQKA